MMSETVDLSLIALSTSCFSIGHLKEINYYIFQYKDSQSPQPSGTGIYEIESEIRRENTSVVMLVYTKEIYLYDLNCDDRFPSVSDRVSDIFRSKGIETDEVSKGSFDSRTIFNNNQLSRQQSAQNKSMPLIYINFLKAIKRLIVWKLADQQDAAQYPTILGFGNHAISFKQSQVASRLLLIDPIYNFNDELLINICEKDLHLERVIPEVQNFSNDDYALYLAPSAVRVYLAGENLKQSLLDEPPMNYEKLLSLLKNYCNIDLSSEKDLKWIKVIPNLNHLNHLTPKISRFLKDYNSGLKYIAWPLTLCFRQRGTHDSTSKYLESLDGKGLHFNPIFNIIDEFIEYNNEMELIKKQEVSLSVMNTPVTTETPVAALELGDTDKQDDQIVQTERLENTEPAYSEPKDEEEDVSMDDDKWDTELFGNDEDEDEDQPMGETEAVVKVDDDDDLFAEPEIDDEIDKYFSESEVELDLTTENNLEELKDDQGKRDEPNVSFIDTSKFINAAGTDNSLYEDPGAPAPVPFAIIAEKTSTNDEQLETDKNKSVFAPLNFNPAIEQSIDKKYLNGGKFYVPHDGDSDSISTEPVEISTIKNFTPVTPSLRKGKFESNNVDSSSDDSDSDFVLDDGDEDEDEDEEEDDGEGDVKKSDDSSSSGSTGNDKKLAGLGLLQFRKNEAIFEDEKLSNLALSSPIKKSDLQPSFSPIVKSESSSPMPSTSENQNWLPFLLKLIPVHTVPPAFMYTNPSVSKESLDDTLPFLLKNFTFDSFNNSSRDPNKSEMITSLNLANYSHTKCASEVFELIEKNFPGIARVSLKDLIKQLNESEKSLKDNYECLTGYGMKGMNGFETSNTRNEYANSPYNNQNDSFNVPGSQEFDSNLFQIPQSLIILNRMDESIKLNQSSIEFWNLLNLQPRSNMKVFEALMILPRFGSRLNLDPSYTQKANDFFSSIVEEYKNSRLGSISKSSISVKTDTKREDIEVNFKLEGGVLEISSSEEVDEQTLWKIISSEVNTVSNLVKSSFDQEAGVKPYLLLMVNPFNSFNSYIEIAKISSTFDKALNLETVEDAKDLDNKKKKRKITSSPKRSDVEVKIFTKVVSLDFFYSPEQTYTIISDQIFNRLSLELYNACPTESNSNYLLIDQPFVTISPELPSKIPFKLTKQNITKSVNSKDLYIHLAYERSIDKCWCIASWTDQYGELSYVKLWYSPPSYGNKSTTSGPFKTFEQISNEIWEITLSYIRSHMGKSYLVLTRLNNIIPDDELVHWKRLSLQTKNLLLIVLAINLNSNLILNSMDPYLASANAFSPTSYMKESGGGKKINIDSVSNNTGLTPFLIGNGDSPELYMTGGNNGNGSSVTITGTPLDINSPSVINSSIMKNNEEMSIVDIMNDAVGIILPNPIPLSNQQKRISIKTGYLIKTLLNNETFTKEESFNTPTPHHQMNTMQQSKQQRTQQQQQQRNFRRDVKDGSNILEINLMSCPNFINGSDLMRELLIQYRNLSNLGEMWGINGSQNLIIDVDQDNLMIPWHILSVRKCLNALVHINVVD